MTSHTLQHTMTHRVPLQHIAIHCNPLQHTAAHCNSLQHTATHCNTLQQSKKLRMELNNMTSSSRSVTIRHGHIKTTIQDKIVELNDSILKVVYTLEKCTFDDQKVQYAATHCNALQRTATYCKTLQRTATYCNTLQHTATRQHTTAHRHTRQHTATHTATHGNTRQHTATHGNTHGSTLQHTATHVHVRCFAGTQMTATWKAVTAMSQCDVSVFGCLQSSAHVRVLGRQ